MVCSRVASGIARRICRLIVTLVCWFGAVVSFSPTVLAEQVPSLVAGGEPVEVPKELVEWVPWVKKSVTEGTCATLGDTELCQWPGILELDVEDQGASFRFGVHLDRDGWVALPGSAVHWPQRLEVDGKRAVVLSKENLPQTKLSAGPHRVDGWFRWAKAPETLQLPAKLGLVRLRVHGSLIDFPRREETGAVWLQASTVTSADATDRSEIEVFRKLEDGNPFEVTTLVLLHVSGKTRELRLPGAMLRGSRPLALDASVPARLEPSGELILQVHAGEHRVTLRTLFPRPEEKIAYPLIPSPWPTHEIWTFVPNSALRQVVLSGAPSIDIAQTNLPEDWKSSQAYLLSESTALLFDTKRRGEPLPPPNQLALSRTFWLDFDGGGYTISDHLSGTISRSFRLDLDRAPLGHVSINGNDTLITRGADGAYGVELRQPKIDMDAEWRYGRSTMKLPAVGWKTDIVSLAATINLPPGWDILHVAGADAASETWWSRWTLWSFFYVLLVTIAIARMFDIKLASLAVLVLILGHDRELAPTAIWAILLVLLVLLRLLPSGALRQGLRAAWLISVLGFAVLTTNYCIAEIRGALFPVTRPPEGATMPNFANANGAPPTPMQDFAKSAPPETQAGAGKLAALSAAAPSAEPEEEPVVKIQQALVKQDNVADRRSQSVAKLKKLSRVGSGSYSEDAMLADPDAVVQTGPGLPGWRWRSVELRWSGPVQQGQEIRAYLLSPPWTKLFAFLRVISTVVLGLLLIRKTPFGSPPPRALEASGVAKAAIAVCLALLAVGYSRVCMAEPSTQVLEELKSRLTRAPDCESCIDCETLKIAVSHNRLAIEAEVHVGKLTSYRVPGPARSWAPQTVRVDGQSATAMVLGSDGFLHVRLLPGRHTVKAEGLIAGRELVITQGTPAHLVEVSADGFTYDGLRDGHVEGSLHFTAAEKNSQTGSTDNEASIEASRHLPPWLEITRRIELGVTWKVVTEVTRKSSTLEPISVRYQLLAGEEVTEPGAIVEQGQLLITLGRDDAMSSYQSVLAPGAALNLIAATDKPWSEQWQIRCGALWHCQFDGIAPYALTDELGYGPKFRPLPGEKLSVEVTKPKAAAGASRTIEQASVKFTPGQRLLSGELGLVAKASKGGPLAIELGAGASVQNLTVNGREEPIRMNGAKLELSLQPGRQDVRVIWHEMTPLRFWFRAPSIHLGDQAVNAKVEVNLPSDRWLLFAWGPSWGPKVLLWSYVAMLVAAGFILVKIPKNPLRIYQWSLLLVGLSQIPVAFAIAIGAWYFLMAYRGTINLSQRWAKKLLQTGLVLYTLFFLGCLCGAVYDGLVSNPDMLVSGTPDADGMHLVWYQDRVLGAMATPVIVSLPVVAFRVLNLLWALWLASSLVTWLKWGWQQFAAFGLWVPRLAPRAATGPSDGVAMNGVVLPGESDVQEVKVTPQGPNP